MPRTNHDCHNCHICHHLLKLTVNTSETTLYKGRFFEDVLFCVSFLRKNLQAIFYFVPLHPLITKIKNINGNKKSFSNNEQNQYEPNHECAHE